MNDFSLRNVAIIAHVDHGKTTLIDSMLRQSGIFRENQQVDERIMDSNDLEKERGITILAKCTAINLDDVKINIIDTPGHADFGGEVERVLNMVDGVVLLVDAAEGPLPQTKFVLSKALKLNLKPMVIINKIDRPDSRASEVLDEIFDLFVSLDASEEQLDFPTLYASGRDGWASYEMDQKGENLKPLFDLIINHVPEPTVDSEGPFKMLATILSADPFLGRMLTGKIYSGTAKMNQPIKTLRGTDNKQIESGRLTKIFTFSGINKVAAEEIKAGDIALIAGVEKSTVADTICSLEVDEAIAAQPIDPPTMSVNISVNDSPLAGKEGSKVTAKMIADRLFKEAESNVAISVTESESKELFILGGRGELQLGVLIENMRREGFELSVSKPSVLYKKDEETGQLLEPIEEVYIDIDEEFSGVVVEKLSLRKGEMAEMKPGNFGKTRLVFQIPSRGLIGYQSEFLTDTRGTGVLNKIFHSYAPYKGDFESRKNGVLISTENGVAVTYSLNTLEDRGILFVQNGDKVYQGMIIGQHNRDNDLEVNPCKAKQLTNMRASGKDETVKLTPPKLMSLEEAISYISDDELVEVTPKSIRLRKKLLDSNERKKASRAKS